jgi:hypothetical protein
MAQLIIDIVVSLLACLAGFFLSWPFWRSYGYWAESHLAWWIYFVTGFLMAAYVFFIFLRVLRTLFLHDALAKAGLITSKPAESAEKGKP